MPKVEPTFIHLRVHSDYSIVDGIAQLKPLVKTLSDNAMPAVALTDQNNLFGMVKFYQQARKHGIKPIIGADVDVFDDQTQTLFSCTLLCLNNTGYLHLIELLSRAYQTRDQRSVLSLEKRWFENTDGLIVLLGCHSDLGQAFINNDQNRMNTSFQFWQTHFPNRCYGELVRTQRENESVFIEGIVPFAEKNQLPLVATNDVRFLSQDDFEAHEARVCIHQGCVLADPNRSQHYSDKQYLRTPDQMSDLFSDLPEALKNSVEIAKRCNVTLSLGKAYLPNFPVPKGLNLETFFEQQANQGLTKRLAKITADHTPYHERLKRELDVINTMGFAGYFLIVADFIDWAKNHGVPVGPGRGSGAGSLAAYALGITDLDPLHYELLFERFLNPERVSMPDFDIDFCVDGRDRVIDYVATRYGRDSVSQIITYGTMAAKAVVRDVGRVLGFPYGFVDTIAKLIPFELDMTLEKALSQEELLRDRYNQEDDVSRLIDLALKLEGMSRNVGKHAGGVVIAPSKLTDFTPIYCEPKSTSLVTQFDKDDIEAVGLVKFDFLGLRTLTIINATVLQINEKRKTNNETLFDIRDIALDDQSTFELLQVCHTTAIFQLESRGMKDLIHRLKPDHFEEIIALVALFRPGPLQSGMVDDFIDRKHGRADVAYPHPDLEPILKTTYGVILYQEQVMQIAQVLAGYTLGAADVLRRAMGKKKPEEMAKQRAIFLAGAEKRGVNKSIATSIFDLMEKFAGYGFNKSHSAAYALVSYQTAWLKTHYPGEFMAAVLSSDMDHTDKVVNYIDECHQMNIDIMPPDLNHSHYRFTVDDNANIRYGLGAIKGVGEGAIIELVKNREKNGFFHDLFDFCKRLDLSKLNRRTLEALIRSGSLDGFKQERSVLLASLDSAINAAEQQSRLTESGQMDLFSTMETTATSLVDYVNVKPLTEQARLQGEKETLGLYLTGHPLTAYKDELSHVVTSKIVNLSPRSDQVLTVAGLITGMRTMQTKHGDRMAFITIDDQSARLEIAVFSDVYQESRSLLTKDNLIIIDGEVSVDDYTGGYKMSAKRIVDLTYIRTHRARCLQLSLAQDEVSELLPQLQACLKPFVGGRFPVAIQYQQSDAKAELMLDQAWWIKPDEELLTQLRALLGENRVMIQYQHPEYA